MPVAVETARKVNGTVTDVTLFEITSAPWYSRSARLWSGVSCSVTVAVPPAAIEGIVASDCRLSHGIPDGNCTVRSPVAAPPVLVTVNETWLCVPTTMPAFR